jgi:hypothetical protein
MAVKTLEAQQDDSDTKSAEQLKISGSNLVA